MKSVDTKLAIVTGAARVIGHATAQLFKQNGYRVALIDKDKEELNNLSTNNVNEKKFCFDISDSTQLDNMYEEILNQDVSNAKPSDFQNILKKGGLDVEEFTDPSLIFDRYKNQVDLVLDGGFGGIYPSSVIDLTDEVPVIIREGAGPCDGF